MKRVPALIPFLALVSALFIGILIFAYVETKRANPKCWTSRATSCTHMNCTLAGWIRARRPSAAPVARTSTPSWWRGVVASGQNFRETEVFQQSLRLG